MFSRFFFPALFVILVSEPYLSFCKLLLLLLLLQPISLIFLLFSEPLLVSGKWQLHKNPSESPHTHSPILLMKVIQDSMSGFSKIRTYCAGSMLHCLKEFLHMLLDFLLRTMFGLLWRRFASLSFSYHSTQDPVASDEER